MLDEFSTLLISHLIVRDRERESERETRPINMIASVGLFRVKLHQITSFHIFSLKLWCVSVEKGCLLLCKVSLSFSLSLSLSLSLALSLCLSLSAV